MSKNRKKDKNKPVAYGLVAKARFFSYLIPFAFTFVILGILIGVGLEFIDVEGFFKSGSDNADSAIVENESFNIELISDEKDGVDPKWYSVGNTTVAYTGESLAGAINFSFLADAPDELKALDIASIVKFYDEDGEEAAPINAGVYTARIVIDTNTYYSVIEREFVITPAELVLPEGIEGDFAEDTVELDYTGKTQSLKINEALLPEGWSVYYNEQSSAVNVGEYNAVATIISNNPNYYSAVFSTTLVINYIDFDLSGVKLDELTSVDYDGKPHTPKLDGILPAGSVSVYFAKVDEKTAIEDYASITDWNSNGAGGQTDAGTYAVKFVFSNKPNYNDAELYATLVINKIEYKGDAILSFDKNDGAYEFIYNGDNTVLDYTVLESLPSAFKELSYVLTVKDEDGNVIYKSVNDKAVSTETIGGKLNVYNGVYDAGKYTATVTVESRNYTDLVYTQDYEIKKASLDYGADFETEQKFVYNHGEVINFNYADPDEIVDDFKATLVIKDADGKEIENIVNAGEYTVILTITSRNYLDQTIEAKVIVDPFVITTEYLESLIKDLVYTGKALSVEFDSLPENVIALVEFEEGKAPVNAGTYENAVIVVSSTNPNYKVTENKLAFKFTVAPKYDPDQYKNVSFGPINGDNKLELSYTGKAPALTLNKDGSIKAGEYSYSKSAHGAALDSAPLDVGEYYVTVVLTKDNYEPFTLTVPFSIVKGKLTGVRVSGGTISFDNKYHAPTLSGEIPEDATITYTLNNEVVKDPGVKTIGTYKYVILIENDNCSATLTTNIAIKFSPIFLAKVTLVILAAGLVLGILAFICYVIKANRSKNKLRIVRSSVINDYGNIRCECYAKHRKLKRGRIYFTEDHLLFYGNKYMKNPHRNLVIEVDDIRSINPAGLNNGTLYIYTKTRVYKLKVPAGSARYFRDLIVNR